MPNKALPLTYLNLGGEMVYVVEQRLNGQKIELTKRKKSILLNKAGGPNSSSSPDRTEMGTFIRLVLRTANHTATNGRPLLV